MKLFAGTFAALALTGGMAVAMTEMDMSWDADGDGMMSADERTAYFPGMTEEDAMGYDADQDGMFNSDEMAEISAYDPNAFRMEDKEGSGVAFPSQYRDASLLRGDPDRVDATSDN